MLKLSKTNGIIPPYTFDGTLHYDGTLSYIRFKGFEANESGGSANIMLGRGRNGIDYVVLFDNEAQKDEPYYKKSHLQKMHKEALIGLWEYHNETSIHYGYKTTYTEAEIIADLMTVTIEQYYRRHCDEVCWYDLESDFIVRGYLQGVAVAVNDLTKHKVWGKDSLFNIFYGSPLSGVVMVYENDSEIETIYLDEFLNSEYETWQPEHKEALIAAIMKRYENEDYANALREYLTTTLPNDYSEVSYTD